MITLLVTHEVDDVDHWRASPWREEFFGPKGITARIFRDREHPHCVGLIVEAPSLEAFEQAMAAPGAAEAMEYDGVRPETITVLTEG